MMDFLDIFSSFSAALLPVIGLVVALFIAYFVFSFVLRAIKKNLLSNAKTKRQISNVEILFASLKYVFVFFLALGAIFYFSGSWTGLGLTLGLLSAAIGLALQKPIAGIAAWVLMVTKRPFEIGDRISIGGVKGDVKDISLTNITLKEVGGLFPYEENSGRMVIMPNAAIFESNIINYTQQDEYVLDQVIMTVTYESDLDKAIEIGLQAAKKHAKEFSEAMKKDPYARTVFQANGIDVHIRYLVPAKRMGQVSSDITREIFNAIRQDKTVELAYPHTKIV